MKIDDVMSDLFHADKAQRREILKDIEENENE